MSSSFQLNKIFKIIPARHAMIDKEGSLPDMVKIFFKCGIVLFRRGEYEKGNHDNNFQECEVEYRNYTDEKLLENYNKLYKLITLKYGEHI